MLCCAVLCGRCVCDVVSVCVVFFMCTFSPSNGYFGVFVKKGSKW